MSAQVKFKKIVAEGKALKWILAFVLGLAVLLLVVLGVYMGTSVIGPAAEQSVPVNSTLRAEDLEFTFGRSYVAPETVRTESALLVAKPDLKGSRRYAGAPAEKSRSASLVAKPDLKGPRRYAGAPAERSRSVSLVANPEIMVYRRYRLDRRR